MLLDFSLIDFILYLISKTEKYSFIQKMDQIKIEVDMEIKEALFQVVQNILQTGEFKVRAEPGSKKGYFFSIYHKKLKLSNKMKNN